MKFLLIFTCLSNKFAREMLNIFYDFFSFPRKIKYESNSQTIPQIFPFHKYRSWFERRTATDDHVTTISLPSSFEIVVPGNEMKSISMKSISVSIIQKIWIPNNAWEFLENLIITTMADGIQLIIQSIRLELRRGSLRFLPPSSDCSSRSINHRVESQTR